MLKLFQALILSVMLATPAVAQQYMPKNYSPAQNFTPTPHHIQEDSLGDGDMWGSETAEQKAAREEKERLAACKRAKLPDSTPFSYYGYRHSEAHCKDWVKQLQDSVGQTCCSSPFTGECRVSRYDFVSKMVEVDGMMSPVPATVKWGVINGLDPDLVLVCASPKWRDEVGKKWRPGTVHCIGRDAGL